MDLLVPARGASLLKSLKMRFDYRIGIEKSQMQGTAKPVYGFLAGMHMNIPVIEAFLLF